MDRGATSPRTAAPSATAESDESTSSGCPTSRHGAGWCLASCSSRWGRVAAPVTSLFAGSSSGSAAPCSFIASEPVHGIACAFSEPSRGESFASARATALLHPSAPDAAASVSTPSGAAQSFGASRTIFCTAPSPTNESATLWRDGRAFRRGWSRRRWASRALAVRERCCSLTGVRRSWDRYGAEWRRDSVSESLRYLNRCQPPCPRCGPRSAPRSAPR